YKKLTANHEMLLEYMSIFHPSTFIKKEIYEREGYYDTFFKSAADYDFLVKLFIKKKRFVYYPMTISIFNNQGISSKNFTLSLKENYVINTKHKSIFKSKLIYFKMIIEHHYFEIRKRVLIFILGKEKLGTLKAHLYSKK
ncbi:MAG: hypothetical protein WCG95_07930, partial [bacterium]